jgi:hypothetical protein
MVETVMVEAVVVEMVMVEAAGGVAEVSGGTE